MGDLSLLHTRCVDSTINDALILLDAHEAVEYEDLS
jgi:hypothetical protein